MQRVSSVSLCRALLIRNVGLSCDGQYAAYRSNCFAEAGVGMYLAVLWEKIYLHNDILPTNNLSNISINNYS